MIQNPLIKLISKIFQLISDIRVTLYNHQILKSYNVNAKVISIGNLTVGGTGKTPHAIYFAKKYINEGFRVAVLSRGYKRKNIKEIAIVSSGNGPIIDPELAGDEPYIISSAISEAIVICGIDRVKIANLAIQQFGAQVLILDDGYQHIRLKRDENILLYDYNDKIYDQHVIPYGRLRESIININRANTIIITKIPTNFDNQYLSNLIGDLKKLCPNANFMTSKQILANLRANKETFPLEYLQNSKQNIIGIAFCAIANHQNFLDLLNDNKISIKDYLHFEDHHWYNDKDLDNIVKLFHKSNADFIVTTAKDYIKIPKSFDLYDKLYCANLEVEIKNYDDQKKL